MTCLFFCQWNLRVKFNQQSKMLFFIHKIIKCLKYLQVSCHISWYVNWGNTVSRLFSGTPCASPKHYILGLLYSPSGYDHKRKFIEEWLLHAQLVLLGGEVFAINMADLGWFNLKLVSCESLNLGSLLIKTGSFFLSHFTWSVIGHVFWICSEWGISTWLTHSVCAVFHSISSPPPSHSHKHTQRRLHLILNVIMWSNGSM